MKSWSKSSRNRWCFMTGRKKWGRKEAITKWMHIREQSFARWKLSSRSKPPEGNVRTYLGQEQEGEEASKEEETSSILGSWRPEDGGVEGGKEEGGVESERQKKRIYGQPKSTSTGRQLSHNFFNHVLLRCLQPDYLIANCQITVVTSTYKNNRLLVWIQFNSCLRQAAWGLCGARSNIYSQLRNETEERNRFNRQNLTISLMVGTSCRKVTKPFFYLTVLCSLLTPDPSPPIFS